jgi:Rrf2 family nitric oxide-sensitive transcriptional repressor
VAEINLDAVVRYTEPDMTVVACLNPVDAPCTIKSCYVLRRALAKAGNAFIAVLDGYTLADLVKPRMPLRRLLAINPPPRARSSIESTG